MDTTTPIPLPVPDTWDEAVFQRWKNALFTATELPTHPQQNAIEIKPIFEATTASVSSDGRISSPSYKEQQYSNDSRRR